MAIYFQAYNWQMQIVYCKSEIKWYDRHRWQNHKLCRYRYFKLYNSINAPVLWVFELFLAIGEKYYDRPNYEIRVIRL